MPDGATLRRERRSHGCGHEGPLGRSLLDPRSANLRTFGFKDPELWPSLLEPETGRAAREAESCQFENRRQPVSKLTRRPRFSNWPPASDVEALVFERKGERAVRRPPPFVSGSRRCPY